MRQTYRNANTYEKRPDKVIKQEEGDVRACSRCKAISREKRWIRDPEMFHEALDAGRIEFTTCPGCQRLQEHMIDGVVELSGEYLKTHRDEAMGVIRRVEEDGYARNPTSKVAEVSQEDGKLYIQTTNKWLAEGIGKEIRKAFKGDLEIQWLEDSDFVRVYWRRD